MRSESVCGGPRSIREGVWKAGNGIPQVLPAAPTMPFGDLSRSFAEWRSRKLIVLASPTLVPLSPEELRLENWRRKTEPGQGPSGFHPVKGTYPDRESLPLGTGGNKVLSILSKRISDPVPVQELHAHINDLNSSIRDRGLCIVVGRSMINQRSSLTGCQSSVSSNQ
jgi:hypothetical protein